MGDGNKVATANNSTTNNTLTTPLVRLPIGHSAVDSSTGALTVFYFHIPTNAGGDLHLKLTGAGEMTIYTPGGKIIGPLTGGFVDVHLSPSTTKSPTHGRYYLFVKGPAPRGVSCELGQTVVSRNGTTNQDPPLLPWNFCFWSTVKNRKASASPSLTEQMEATLVKYASAYGHNAARAVKWENDHHFVASGEEWVGHCNFMSRASILFEQPIAHTAVGVDGVKYSFSAEELEFLANEWFGVWATSSRIFTADTGHPAWYQDDDAVFWQKLHWHSFLKPSDLLLDDKELRATLKDSILFHITGSQPDEATAKTIAAKWADKFIARGNRAEVQQEFGHLAAHFYRTLVERMYHQKHALVANLRGAGSGNPPTEVWNHALFRLNATFKEVLPTDRELTDNQGLMGIVLDLTANYDYPEPPTAAPPAVVVHGDVLIDDRSVMNRRSWNALVIAFDTANGEVIVDVNEKRHRWLRCRHGRQGGELYMPALLIMIEPVGTTMANAQQSQEPPGPTTGNDSLDLDIVSGPTPLLEVRKRYLK